MDGYINVICAVMVPPILFSETRFFQNLKLKSVFLLIFMNSGNSKYTKRVCNDYFFSNCTAKTNKDCLQSKIKNIQSIESRILKPATFSMQGFFYEVTKILNQCW